MKKTNLRLTEKEVQKILDGNVETDTPFFDEKPQEEKCELTLEEQFRELRLQVRRLSIKIQKANSEIILLKRQIRTY